MVNCDGATPEAAAAPPRAHVSVSGGFSRAHLIFFDGTEEVRFDHGTLRTSSDLYLGRFVFSLGIGATLPGSLVTESHGDLSTTTGVLGTAGLSWRVLDDEGALPYVVLTASLGGLSTATEQLVTHARGQYLGVDFRFGGTVGKTLWGWFSPYAALRVFGGPVLWTVDDEVRVGTDRYHVQGSGGAVFLLPGSVDLFVEASPGGEQGGTAGVGMRF